MRLGEEQLYARYTNLKVKQKQEEELMNKMFVGESTATSKQSKINSKSLVKVSCFKS